MKKKIATTTPDNVETGLGPIPIEHWDGTEFWTKEKKPVRLTTLAINTEFPETHLIREIKESGLAAAKNESLPDHTRMLGQWLTIMAATIGQKLYSTKIDPMEIARLCLIVGMTFERFKLSENERPALAGKKIRAAAQRKGRSAPENSLRDYFVREVKDWKTMTNAGLRIAAQKRFPNRNVDSILRQIRRLKKAGQ